MAETLVIAEKPSVARDIARALGSFRRAQGYLESPDTIVTWAVGHLVELAEPEDYDPRYRVWRLEDLPILPSVFRLRPIARTRAQLEVIRRLLARPDVRVVVNACDAGREGELIFRYLMEAAAPPRPLEVRRLWLSALTEEAIREGFGRLRDGAELDRLAAAARCRSQGDWMVGINATRGMTRRAGTLVSVGRVQTPTLALLVQREQAIESFVPRAYWVVEANFEPVAEPARAYRGRWFDPASGEDRVWDEAHAAALVGRVRGAAGSVERVEQEEGAEPPPLLFDLTQLQREMNRRHGFTAQKTLRLAQELYERDKAITYPRTDSRFLPGSLVPVVYRVMRALAEASQPAYREVAGVLLETKLAFTGRVLNDKKVTDHHAIIPTPRRPPDLTGDKALVYDAIVRRFMAVFLPAARWRKTTVLTRVAGELFRSRGRVLLEHGWLRVEPPAPGRGNAGPGEDAEDADTVVPPLEPGEPVTAADAAATRRETRPPPRHTEASLLYLMETAGNLVEDEALRDLMKDHGLGTPATRAAIIERLVEVGYVERRGKVLVPTEKGRELIKVLPARELVSPELTGRWEKRLRDVERGAEEAERFLGDLRAFAARVVVEIKAMAAESLVERMRAPLGACPRCGRGQVVENRMAYGCDRWKDPIDPCGFKIWKVIASRRIDRRTARRLIEGRATGRLGGFRSRNGKPFAAALRLNDQYEVEFHFPPRPRARQGDASRSGGPPGTE